MRAVITSIIGEGSENCTLQVEAQGYLRKPKKEAFKDKESLRTSKIMSNEFVKSYSSLLHGSYTD
jgi:hypothetical protein